MLCNEKENGIEKCVNYWSEKNKLTKYKIEIVKEKEKKNLQCKIRDIKLINSLTKKEIIVKQIHFIGWPDHGVPDTKDGKIFNIFTEIIKLVDEYRKDCPIVVHCSAGVGRTGTFISIYCLYHEIKKQIEDKVKEIHFSIFNFVRKLKEMRLYSVQTEIQYIFIYSYVYNLLLTYNK